jgi:hypothetical protein
MENLGRSTTIPSQFGQQADIFRTLFCEIAAVGWGMGEARLIGGYDYSWIRAVMTAFNDLLAISVDQTALIRYMVTAKNKKNPDVSHTAISVTAARSLCEFDRGFIFDQMSRSKVMAALRNVEALKVSLPTLLDLFKPRIHTDKFNSGIGTTIEKCALQWDGNKWAMYNAGTPAVTPTVTPAVTPGVTPAGTPRINPQSTHLSVPTFGRNG